MQGPGFCSFYWRDLISFVVYPDNHNRKSWKTSINVLRILTWHLVTHWSSFHLSNEFSSSIFHVLHSVRLVPLTLHSELLPITELWDVLQDSSWLLIERRCQGGVLNERAPNRVTFKPESVIRDDEDERKVARCLAGRACEDSGLSLRVRVIFIPAEFSITGESQSDFSSNPFEKV